MTKENLLKYLRDPAYLHQISYQELKTLVAEHPNSLSLRYLLAVKSKQENNGDFDRQLAFLATYTIDRAHLFDVFNKEEELSLNSDSILLQEDYFELKELSTLERELGAVPLIATTNRQVLELEPAGLPEKEHYEKEPIQQVKIIERPTEEHLLIEEDFYVLDFDEETEIEETKNTEEVVLSDAKVADNLAEIEDLFKDLGEEETIEEVPATINSTTASNSQLLRETLISGTFTEIPLEIIDTNVNIVGTPLPKLGGAVSDEEANTVSIDYLQKKSNLNKREGQANAEESNIVKLLTDEQILEPTQRENFDVDKKDSILLSYQENSKIDNQAEVKEQAESTPIIETILQVPEVIEQQDLKDEIEVERSPKAIKSVTIFEQSRVITGLDSLQPVIEDGTNQSDNSILNTDNQREEINTEIPSSTFKEEIDKEALVRKRESSSLANDIRTPDYVIPTNLSNQISEEELIKTPVVAKEEQVLIPSYIDASLVVNPLPKASFTTWYKQGGRTTDFAGFDLVGFNSKGIIDELTEEERISAKTEEIPKTAEKTVTVRKVISRADQSLVFEEDIASETLAQLLILQGHYSKAMAMYEQLSLIFPEKSSLFAGEIKKIENLEDEIT